MITSTTCPVCGYPALDAPPRSLHGPSYEICPSCGFEFGVTDDDLGITDERWRAEWLDKGAPWSSASPRPDDWNPHEQVRAVQ